jgi:hypothetical protein
VIVDFGRQLAPPIRNDVYIQGHDPDFIGLASGIFVIFLSVQRHLSNFKMKFVIVETSRRFVLASLRVRLRLHVSLMSNLIGAFAPPHISRMWRSHHWVACDRFRHLEKSCLCNQMSKILFRLVEGFRIFG